MIQEALKETNYFVQGAAYIGAVGALGVFVWGSLKGLTVMIDRDWEPCPARHRFKSWVSWLLGPFYALAFYWLGYLPVPGPEIAGWVVSPFMGLAGTFLAFWKHSRSKTKEEALEAGE